jgi:hypothetical protein
MEWLYFVIRRPALGLRHIGNCRLGRIFAPVRACARVMGSYAELTNPISKNSEIAANLICRARPTEGNSGGSVHEAVRRVGCVPGL